MILIIYKQRIQSILRTHSSLNIDYIYIQNTIHLTILFYLNSNTVLVNNI